MANFLTEDNCMKKLFLPVMLSLITTFCVAQSQAGMNESAKKDYENADAELNNVYTKIMSGYKEDTAFMKNLKTAQKLWIKLRDADMKAKYPDRGEGYYGSAQLLCWYSYLTQLTKERTDKLKIWLTGIEEGDVCAGSVKRKN